MKESYDLLEIDGIYEAHQDFLEIAKLWKDVSDLFFKIGETRDVKYVNEASTILLDLSERERVAMKKLNDAFGR